VGFLLLVSLVASATLTAVENFFNTFVTQWAVILPLVELTLSFAMTTLLFAMIYKYIPRERLAWSDVWTGAVTALLFTIGKFLIGLYLGKSSFNSAYGRQVRSWSCCCGFITRRRYFYLARNSHVWFNMVRAARQLASDAFLHGPSHYAVASWSSQ
jgi:hypothetical protein